MKMFQYPYKRLFRFHEICMQNPRGIHAKSMWNPCGTHEESIRNPWGINMEPILCPDFEKQFVYD